MNRRALLAGLLVVACAGCGADRGPEGDVVLRWIEDDPQVLLSADSYLDPSVVFEKTVKTAVDRALWQLNDLEPVDSTGVVYRFVRSGADPWLATEIEIDTEEISVIEIELVNIPRVGLQLFWAGPGQKFSRERVEAARSKGQNGLRKTFRFELGSNPSWRGQVDRLRVDLSPEIEGRKGIVALRGYGRSVNPEGLAATIARPWKIALGSKTRNALSALPGLEHDRRLTIPPGANLVFGFGLQPAIRDRVRFTIRVVEEGGGEDIVFDRTVGAGNTRYGSWHDARVDLGDYAGRAVTLRLATDEIPGFDVTHGLPVWSNPELVAPVEADRRPNVLVILLDTLRSDHLSSHGYDLPTSPAIDRWGGASAVRFSTTVAPAPWTLPSHVSIFTGLEAMRHGFNYWGTAPAALDMIAETLRDEGYSTAAFTGGGVLLPMFGYAQGFDVFETWTDPDSSTEIDWAFGRATEWLEQNRDRRFFLFLHTYEVHFPHRRREPYFSDFADRRGANPPGGEIDLRERQWENLQFPGLYFLIKRPGSESWEEPLTDAEIDLVGLMYDSAIRHADDYVRGLLDHLDHLGLTENTIVILTSDHGEELGDDRGRAGHAYVSEANVLVPLFIARPGGPGAGTVVDQQVRLIDLQPTILDLIGIDAATEVDGRSLVPLMDGVTHDFPQEAWTYAASSNLGLAVRRDNDLKYLFSNAAWSELADREELFNLAEDPGEDHNLADGDPRLPALRDLARETILEQHRGYRLEISNSGRKALNGVLTGSWARHDRVKTADHGCGCVSRPKNRPPTFAVPTGASTALLFEGLEGSAVGLKLRPTDRSGKKLPPVLIDFDLSEIETPAAVIFSNGQWQLVENHEAAVETGFVITRHGPEEQIATGRRDAEAETLEQLKALGYVQ